MVRQHRHIVRRFDDRERERLGKLFRQLGTDNLYEAEAARGRIDSLLRQFSKSWSDLVSSLSGRTPTIHPALAADIAGPGDPDPDRRAGARRNLAELLARHRKTWNDLSDALCSITSAPWLNPSAAPDPERVNPLELLHYILQDYVDLRAWHEYVIIALWALHTHVFSQFMVTPRLVLRSPTAGCGKTQMIDVLSKLTARPEKFELDHRGGDLPPDRRIASDANDRRGRQSRHRASAEWPASRRDQFRTSFWRPSRDHGRRRNAEVLDLRTFAAGVA